MYRYQKLIVMRIIWYNPDEQTYKCGSTDEMSKEISASKNKSAYTVLMKFKNGSRHMAEQVLKQLNVLNESSNIPVLF